jgi:ABC-2 type transport system ATP-binding protein
MNDRTQEQLAAPVYVEGLTRRFRRTVALDNLSLSVPAGCVYGLIGENGAGKTTLLKHLLGLLKAQTGQVRVFGMDPVREPEKVLGRIGYLSENRDLPPWMRVAELMRYTQAFYPKWDQTYAEELRQTFDLDPSAKIKTLSRGQKAQAGLLAALAHRPDLLLLDEPSSGLDAVVRRDILGAIIRTVADEGRTVLFSSHLLDEVERVADYIAMIYRGRLVLCAPLDDLKAGHRRVTLQFPDPMPAPPALTGVLDWQGHGRDWTALCTGPLDAFRQAAAEMRADIAAEAVPTLEEIFVARVKGGRNHTEG